jgi:predicted CopG family antitoxin
MHSASQMITNYPLAQRATGPLGRARDWLDERGRPAWIAAMVLGFIGFWPLGLAILGYMIWSKRMFACTKRSRAPRYYAPSTGNLAFDAYREETLKRLEDEHSEFIDFLQKLREAKDKAEFDQFMEKRGTKSED